MVGGLSVSVVCPLSGDAVVCARDRECVPSRPCAMMYLARLQQCPTGASYPRAAVAVGRITPASKLATPIAISLGYRDIGYRDIANGVWIFNARNASTSIYADEGICGISPATRSDAFERTMQITAVALHS
eukprot:6213310-Pleurochrysis_carterae.AAC.2